MHPASHSDAQSRGAIHQSFCVGYCRGRLGHLDQNRNIAKGPQGSFSPRQSPDDFSTPIEHPRVVTPTFDLTRYQKGILMIRIPAVLRQSCIDRMTGGSAHPEQRLDRWKQGNPAVFTRYVAKLEQIMDLIFLQCGEGKDFSNRSEICAGKSPNGRLIGRPSHIDQRLRRNDCRWRYFQDPPRPLDYLSSINFTTRSRSKSFTRLLARHGRNRHCETRKNVKNQNLSPHREASSNQSWFKPARARVPQRRY